MVWQDNRSSSSLNNGLEGCENCANNQFDIYMYDFNTQTEQIIATNKFLKTYPDIYENTVVWVDYRLDDPGIYSFDLDSRTEKRLIKFPGATNPNPNSSLDSRTKLSLIRYPFASKPNISKYFVSWRVTSACDVYPQTSNTGVFIYSRQSEKNYQVTDYVEPSFLLDENVLLISEGCHGGADIYTLKLSIEQ